MTAGPQRLVAAAAALTMLAGACGGGDSAENVLEQLAEQESGEDVDVEFEDGELNVQTEDGEFSIEVDDDGNFTIEGESDGEVFSGEGSADPGDFSFETEDGDISFEGGDSVPEGWPDEVPIPDDMTIVGGQTTTSGDEAFYTIVGEVDDGPSWFDSYRATLESAGFTEATTFTQDEQSFAIFESAAWTVQVNVSQFEGAWQTTVLAGSVQR